MRIKAKRKIHKIVAVAMTVLLSLTAFGGAFSELMPVKAAEEPAITATTHSYEFGVNTGKVPPVLGGVIDGTASETSGIVWYATTGNNVSFDSNQLKFRAGTTVYIPIKDDTTKITYKQICNGDSPTRLTYVGTNNGTNYVDMAKSEQSVTIDDITDMVKEYNGQKYIALYSNGDVKVTKMTLTEYNPINSVTVSGKITNAAENSISQISFKNLDDNTANIVSATIDSLGNYTATLKRIAGNTNYVASVSKTGYKIDNTGSVNQFALTGNATTSEQNFSIVAAEIAKLSGTVTGISDSALKDTLKLKLVPSDNTLDSVYLTLQKVSDGNYTYENAIITPDITYTAVLENANDYEVVSTITKPAGIITDVTLAATAKPLYKATGSFVTSDEKSATVNKITYTNMNEPGYSYTFDVTGNAYAVSLRAGEYVTSAEVSGYTVFDHVSIKDADVINDIYLEAPQDISAVAYRELLNVGKGKDFETITAALNYIKRMTRTANQRVTINLTDDLYREQVTVNTPNVTITSTNAKAPTVTWYYGIGYSYYSVAPATEVTKGYYTEKYAVDKYTKTVVDTHWGTVVEVTIEASGFKSENITYESSFNRYMTAEEVMDGVGAGGDSAKINRSIATDADVKTTANKERACAMYIEADNCEYTNCSFLSSQDTMFTGNGEESIYFKNCIIEGTTDFICGNGNPVFDNCTLSIYGYGNQAADGGYVTASKAGGSQGYLFYNCKIVRTEYSGINVTTKNIYFGRPWGAGTKVLFYNTEVATADLIAPAAYASMSTVTPADAFYAEYNTHTPDGTALDTSGRATGTILLTADQAKVVSVASYFGDWLPTYYYADYAAVDAEIAKANALIPAEYVDFTGVTAAINAVTTKYVIADQAKVDAMAKAISNAVAALVKKVVVPTEPTNPTSPTEPTSPTNPTSPTSPTSPTNPTTPTNPTAPTNPVEPVSPTNSDSTKTVVKEAIVKNESGQEINIKLTGVEGVIPESAKLESIMMTSGTGFEAANKVIQNNSKFVLFDLNILNASGTKIQPDGSLDISVDIPEGYSSEKIKVYRIEEDGTKTDMNAIVSDGKVVFKVSHFSLYAIVEESTVNTLTVADVKTGDSSMIWFYGMLSIAALGVLGVSEKKRREVKA